MVGAKGEAAHWAEALTAPMERNGVIGFILCKLIQCWAESGPQGRGQAAFSAAWVGVMWFRRGMVVEEVVEGDQIPTYFDSPPLRAQISLLKSTKRY